MCTCARRRKEQTLEEEPPPSPSQGVPLTVFRSLRRVRYPLVNCTSPPFDPEGPPKQPGVTTMLPPWDCVWVLLMCSVQVALLLGGSIPAYPRLLAVFGPLCIGFDLIKRESHW